MKPLFLEKLMGRMDRLDTKSVAAIIERLAEQKGFLETVFNALQEGVIVLDSSRKVLYINQAAHDLLGLTPETMARGNFPRHLPEAFWKTMDKEFKSGNTSVLHQDIEISYPVHRFLQIYANSIRGESVKKSNLLLILRDVTDEHRRMALSAETERMGVVTTLAAGVAHEIGNPLNSLHIYLQLMERELPQLEGTVREKLEKHLKVCTSEIARLDQIVSQFLKAVRPTRPTLEPHSINQILIDVIEVIGVEISNRDILVEKDLARDLPNVPADLNQMKQVFFNLIRNSMQAMSSEGILHIKTELQGDRVLVTIRDTGGGIPSEALQHIFEPYFTTKNEGSGLGLMIVQRVIREHGGLIEVSSEQGRGTTFRISLPTSEKRTRLLPTT